MVGSDETKRCSRCGETRPVSEFSIKNTNTGLRRTWCRACARAYGREHYRRNRWPCLLRSSIRRRKERPRIAAAVADYLHTHPCVDCGETDLVLLDF